MNRDVAKLIDWAKTVGFTYEGFDGRGHHRLRHHSGQTCTVPGTPSDHRSLPNTEAMLRRVAGVAKEGVKHRRSRKADAAVHFDMHSTRKWIDGPGSPVLTSVANLNAEAKAIRGRLHELVAEPTRDGAVEARSLLLRFTTICDDLRALHKPEPPPLNL